MRLFLLLSMPLWLLAQSYSLPQLIDHASKYNKQIKSKSLQSDSAMSEVEAQERDFWPTLDIGAQYTNTTPSTLISPSGMGIGYASVGVDVYDGGRKSALLKSKNFLFAASRLEQQAFEKSIALNIVNHYYTVLKLRSIIKAMKAQTREIHTQIQRMKKFASAGLATQEDVDKLQAEFDNNEFTIANAKLNLRTAVENLSLLSGVPAEKLKRNRFLEPKRVSFEAYEKSKILHANAEALKENANAIDAGYLPQLRLEDTYSRSTYNGTNSIPGIPSSEFYPDHQNKLMVSVNMRLFDHSKMKKEREAVMYKKLAADSESQYAIEEQHMQYKLAKSRMQTIRAKGRSAKSALRAATSTHNTVVKKYEAGLVDNITYLDALNNKTLSDARYKEALYDYEISKSVFYYFAGKNIKEFIR